jgi:hypothetical protein
MVVQVFRETVTQSRERMVYQSSYWDASGRKNVTVIPGRENVTIVLVERMQSRLGYIK